MSHPYQHYKVKDFLSCPKFREWVLTSDHKHQQFWSSFLALHPEKSGDIDKASYILLKLHRERHLPKANMMEADWQIIKTSIQEDKKKLTINRFFQYPWAVAASVSLICMLTLAVWLFLSQYASITHTTQYGETKKIELPDGSIVVVNANSEISYSSDWKKEGHRREVWLEGEAWFEVEEVYANTKDSHEQEKVKFIVHTAELEVEVVGTAFNVNSRTHKTQVTLSSGKVIVRKEGQQIAMIPGEQLELSHMADKLVKKKVVTDNITSWKDNKLIFENKPLAQVFELFHERYGWNISVEPKAILEYQYTGSVPADQPELLLDKLSVLYQLEIKRNDDEIIIKSLPGKTH